MDTWYYLKALNNNKKIHYYPTCPYCGEFMEILTKIFKVRFKTLKVPPIGANELNIYQVTTRIFKKKFVICGICKAKYNFDYDHNLVPHLRTALSNIPSSTILLNDFIDIELSKFPSNTTCELMWRKSFHKKVSDQKPNQTILPSYNKLIKMLIAFAPMIMV